jgi:hypothetical protein
MVKGRFLLGESGRDEGRGDRRSQQQHGQSMERETVGHVRAEQDE